MFHPPREIERPWHRVNGTDSQLNEDLNDRPNRHRDSPVTDTVIDHEHLTQSATHGALNHHHNHHICYSMYMPRQFRSFICPSVTRVYCIKTAERIIEILSLSDRPITLVFRQQGSLRISSPPTGMPNTRR